MDGDGETQIEINGENTSFSRKRSLDFLSESLSLLKNRGNDVSYDVTYDPIDAVGKSFVKEDRRGAQ